MCRKTRVAAGVISPGSTESECGSLISRGVSERVDQQVSVASFELQQGGVEPVGVWSERKDRSWLYSNCRRERA